VARSHSIGATALSTYCVEEGALLGVADLGGSSVNIPYRTGRKAGTRTLKGRDYQIFVAVKGDGDTLAESEADFYTKCQGLAALVLNLDGSFKPQPFTLSRTLPHTGGDQTCTIAAIYKSGLEFPEVGLDAARTTLTLELLDGWWLSGATKVFL
jgi:hypothetical protein